MSETSDFSRVITENKLIQPGGQTMQSKLTANAAVVSHMGCVRRNNEDNFFFDGDLMQDDVVNDGALIQATISQQHHLFAVCDGMGGLKGGERASSIGVHSMVQLNKYMPAANVSRAIDAYALDTCERVYQDGVSQGEAGREGTTLALLYMADGKAYAANVGDSRVYVLRMGKLFQVSTDHSPVYKMMQRGELTREQMRKHPRGNVIELFMGMAKARLPKAYVSHFTFQICSGDRFLICSDGLSDLLMHEEIQQALNDNPTPKDAALQLVARALEMGGKDNTTCIVVDVSGDSLPAATAMSLAAFPKEKQ